jgi:hypothetical protein
MKFVSSMMQYFTRGVTVQNYFDHRIWTTYRNKLQLCPLDLQDRQYFMCEILQKMQILRYVQPPREEIFIDFANLKKLSETAKKGQNLSQFENYS